MALPSTMHRFKIKLSDVDRGIYDELEFRVAMHPSEAAPYLLTRVIAYCLNYAEGIELTGGIGTPDDPAIWIKDLTGSIVTWIDVGNPSARRLHKASKASKSVIIYTYRDPAILMTELAGEEIHKKSEISVVAVQPKFLNALAETLDRDNPWELLHTEGELSVTARGRTFQTELQSLRLE